MTDKPIKQIFKEMINSIPKEVADKKPKLVFWIGRDFHDKYKFKTYKGIPVCKYYIKRYDRIYLMDRKNCYYENE